MARWQRHARWVLAVITVGVIAVVAYTIRPREIAKPAAKPAAVEPGAVVTTLKGDAIQFKGASQDVRVEYEVQTTNEQQETKLRGVKIMVDNRAGRNYVVTGKEAFLGKQNSSFDVRGDVKLVTSDGLTATSQQATYANADGIVRVPGDVTFSRGRMNGSGVGFTYDQQRDIMTILDKADVKFAAEGDQQAMAFTAGTFTYARKDRYMQFDKTMHMDREGQVIDADSSMVRLFPDRDEPDYVELRNGSRVTGNGASSALKSMTARDINLDYADDGRTLQNAALVGQGEIQVAGTGGGASQKLDGETMDIGLEPDGSVRSLNAHNAVTVTLPATKETSARTIRSNTLAAAGTAQGLRDMHFTEGVEYKEAASKTQAGRTIRARTLDAVLDPAAGTLKEAHFLANVDVTDTPLHAIAADARYNVDAGTMALSGVQPAPHVETDALTIDATTIDVTLNPRKMAANGNVRCTLLPPKKPTGNETATKRPALLGDKDPVNVVSETFTYDEAAHTAQYASKTGQTVLLQGDTTIRSQSLSLDETKGDLTATGKVITNLVIANKDADPKVKAKPTIARAESFTYADDTRKATYTTAAQMNGEQGNLSGGKIEMQLAKDDNALDRLEANGAVTAIVDKRTVTGTRLTFSPTDDKYVVNGAPVKMIDAECQETTGKTLTFWKSSDRVLVDGNNEVRTQTKGGGKCTVAPPQ